MESQEFRASLAEAELQVRLSAGSPRNKICVLCVQNLCLHRLWQLVTASSLPQCEYLPIAFSPKHGAHSASSTCLDSCWVFWARIIKRHEGQIKSANDFENEFAKSSGLPGHVRDAQNFCI